MKFHRPPSLWLCASLLAVSACGDSKGAGTSDSDATGTYNASLESISVSGTVGVDSSTGAATSGNASASSDASDASGGMTDPTNASDPTDDPTDDSGVKFDVGQQPDASEMDTEGECAIPDHTPCDHMDDDPWHAIGINCPGEFQVVTNYMGDPQMLHVHTGAIGTYQPPPFPVHEGQKIAIISSGVATDVVTPGSLGSTDIPGQDPGNLPNPMNPNPVAGDCTMNAGLIGTGDCSSTINDQWSQGTGAYDYAELRLIADVPEGVYGFSYDFIFFSTEYPVYFQTQYNDMYIAWLQSEAWTGNVSFDEQGNPISLNAGFLDYKDGDAFNDPDCPCSAPELQGTCLVGHAATKWLTTTAGVNAGEQITLIFAVFDLSDNILDSMIAIDNFEWQCEGGPPQTAPG